jgi:hypothetical protein
MKSMNQIFKFRVFLATNLPDGRQVHEYFYFFLNIIPKTRNLYFPLQKPIGSADARRIYLFSIFFSQYSYLTSQY